MNDKKTACSCKRTCCKQLAMKINFVVIIILSAVLTACTGFARDPIEPNIIGTGNLQYDTKNGTWFVVVDSTKYTVNSVISSDQAVRTESKRQSVEVEPAEGMLVTIFVFPHLRGIQAITGKKSITEIEETYSQGNPSILVALIIVFVGMLASALAMDVASNEDPW